MAEVFGNRDDFAIEAGVEPDKHTTGTVWGHMCVWCHGVPLGDLDKRYCGLHHAYSELVWRADNLESLWAEELAGMDDIVAWYFLDGLLYGYYDDIELEDSRTLEECREDAAQWGHFNFLTNWDEQFDGYKSFLLCPPGDSLRVLSRRLPPHFGRGVSISRQGFVSAVTQFAEWFESESARLSVPCTRPS